MDERNVARIARILENFVFLDKRLSDSNVRGAVLMREGGSLVRVATSHPPARGFSVYDLDGGSAAAAAARERGYIVSSDLVRGGGMRPAKKSFVAVPVIGIANDVAGVICLDSETTEFRDVHVGMVQLLAALVDFVNVHISGGERRATSVSTALGVALAQVRKDVGLTQEVLAGRLGVTRVALSRWEGGQQPPSWGQLERWCEGLGILGREQRPLVHVADITPTLLHLLRTDPEEMRRMSPEQFEYFVAGRLDRMGFQVQLTGRTNQRDGGIDLIAVPRGSSLGTFLLAGQVKHHSDGRRSGREAVDRLLSWRYTQFHLGLLVTNTGFTRDALWTAGREENRPFLRLRDFEDLKRWLEDDFQAETELREMPDHIELAPGVSVAVPKPRLQGSLDIWPAKRVKWDSRS